jgi:hypothetical protein
VFTNVPRALLLDLAHVTGPTREKDACHRGYAASWGAASWNRYRSTAPGHRCDQVGTRLDQEDYRGGVECGILDQAAVAMTHKEMQWQAHLIRPFRVEGDYEHARSLVDYMGSPAPSAAEQENGRRDQTTRLGHCSPDTRCWGRINLQLCGDMGQCAAMSPEDQSAARPRFHVADAVVVLDGVA